MSNFLDRILSATEFLERRHELPEGGQWSELDAGLAVDFQPPDLDHGNTLLNLSKSIGAWAPTSDVAYACYDLGFLINAGPDTVRFPAMSIFCSGERFAEMDKEVTETVPEVIVELASTSDRRALYPQRAEQYLNWGVSTVWIIDPREQTLESHSQADVPSTIASDGVLQGDPWLNGFRVTLAELFVEPDWWTGKKE